MASTTESLDPLTGTWTLEATHPAMPGVVVHGTAAVEWLEGRKFLIHRARNEHPDFPDSISIIGVTGHDRVEPGKDSAEADGDDSELSMHYFDSRGVFRTYQVSIDENEWRLVRMAPGFSQRFRGTIGDGGAVIDGLWQVCEDGVHWNDDLKITYRRARE